ncbi:hypothetical protein E2K80_18145 [Rhodophyticola sp. CCM32]|uniref:hypothetical protein n=1 Tax=Rhodophyticola sp. CCM32 TaxID=2916397 RepID=UPI00107F9335|nr:hypothetical protein [Rhodophyticola sp. CCM32]QBY02426.1 hypothetical protein E2K80_18145 [Rhodophyticola sp. CCM32]
MSLIAIAFFLLGFAASWVAGRYIARGAAAVQGGAIGVCGVAALIYGMPGVWATSVTWAIVALLVYGLIGALIFRSGQAAREKAE